MNTLQDIKWFRLLYEYIPFYFRPIYLYPVKKSDENITINLCYFSHCNIIFLVTLFIRNNLKVVIDWKPILIYTTTIILSRK